MHAKADFFAARKDFVVIRTYFRTLKDTLKISFSLYNKLETFSIGCQFQDPLAKG